MEGETCTVCGGPLNVGDHTHGGDAAPMEGGSAPADGGMEGGDAAPMEGGSAPADAAPASEAKKPWWKFW